MTASVSTAGPGGISLASANLTGTFSLAAHSSLTITWSLDVQGQGQSNGINTQEIVEEYIVGAGVLLTGADPSNEIFLQGPIFPNFAFGQTQANNQLTIQTGDTGMDVNFSAYIDLQLVDPGNSPLHFGWAPAVPEPETWAMALVGLALVGAGAPPPVVLALSANSPIGQLTPPQRADLGLLFFFSAVPPVFTPARPGLRCSDRP